MPVKIIKKILTSLKKLSLLAIKFKYKILFLKKMDYIKLDSYDHYPEFDMPGFKPVIIRKMPASLDIKTLNFIDPMAFYRSFVDSLPKLTKKETRELLKEYNYIKYKGLKNGEKISELEKKIIKPRNEIVSLNIKYAMGVATKYVQKCRTEENDLIQEANKGLMIAVDRFRHHYYSDKSYDENVKFDPFLFYAKYRIKAEIFMTIYKEGIVNIPIEVGKKLNQMKRAYEELLSLHEREPMPEELARIINLSENSLSPLLMAWASQETTSLDIPLNEEKDFYLRDMIADKRENINAMDRRILKKEAKDALDFYKKNAHNRNDRRRVFVLESYFLEGKNLQEISEILDVTREDVRQVKNIGVRKIRKKLGIKSPPKIPPNLFKSH